MTKLRKNIGIMGLLYASIGSMIGSGWLFGALIAVQQAGVLSIFSWIIGALAIAMIALVYAELSTMFPKSGVLVHLSHIGHGSLLGRLWSWILILAYIAVAPIEVMAILAYANNYLPYFINEHTQVLTTVGVCTAISILGVVVLLNFFAVKWVVRFNSTLTFWKIIIPVITIVILFALSSPSTNFTVVKKHYDITHVFTTVATAGIIFSYFGFRGAVDLAGESNNPARNIPIAIFGSLGMVSLIYIGLQAAFIWAVPNHFLSHGWVGLNFSGSAGPIATIVTLLGATWWAVILYVDAFVSPFGSSYIYTTTTSRVIMATGETDSTPYFMKLLNRHGAPWLALLATFVLGAVFFLPFPSWRKMVTYVSSVTVLSYCIGPILILQLRLHAPKMKRPFKLKGIWIIAPLAFFISNSIVFCSGYSAVNFMMSLLLIFFILYLFWQYVIKRIRTEDMGWQFVWWVIPYFTGLWLISHYGPKMLGGNGHLTFFGGILCTLVLSIITLFFSLRSGVPKSEFTANVKYINSLQNFAESQSKN